MKTKYLIAALVILSSFELAFACGPEWTYIGYDYQNANSIVELSDSAGIFLRCGQAQGIYRWAGQDTTWERISFTGYLLKQLFTFPSYPHQIYALAANGSLFRSRDNGFVWDTIRVSDSGGFFNCTDFTINPSDSMNWFIAGHNADVEVLFVSNDAGQTWERAYVDARCWDITWFTESPDIFYFRNHWFSSLRSMRLTDYSEDFLISLGSDYSILSLIRHPAEPWIYVLGVGQNGPRKVVRYNILTSDTTTRIIPDTLFCTDDNSYLRYIEGQGLLVGGGYHFYLLSDDLQNIQVINTPEPNETCFPLLFASQNIWITSVFHRGLYCRSPIDQVSSDHQDRATTQFEYYPNPAREMITFQTTCQQAGRVEIYNILGRKVFEWAGASTGGPLTVPLTSLSSGTYFFRLYTSSTDQMPLWHDTFTIIK